MLTGGGGSRKEGHDESGCQSDRGYDESFPKDLVANPRAQRLNELAVNPRISDDERRCRSDCHRNKEILGLDAIRHQERSKDS